MATAARSACSVFRFGDFEFRPDPPELRKLGLRLKLQPKPLLVLVTLLENAGKVVTREQLQNTLWPDDVFVDFELGLNVAVKKLRDVLSDSAEEPRFIETVVGSGYRFIARVERLGSLASQEGLECSRNSAGPIQHSSVESLSVSAAARAATPRNRSHGGWLAIAAGIVLIASIGLGWNRFHRQGPLLKENDWVLIANFDNRTGEAVLDGTLETALRRELSDSRFVKVAPAERVSDTLRLMKRPPDTRVDAAIGREICLRDGGIQALITGRIEKLAGLYVATAFVINPANGVTIAASEEQARSQDSLLPAIHRLSNSILRSLAGQEVDSKDQRLEKVTTTSLEALSLFSRAESTMRSGGGPRAQAEAEQLLRRAVDLDPQFASAWNLLAWTIWNQGRSQSEYLPISDKAIEYAGTATDHEAQFIRATSYRFHEETDRAIAAFEAVAEAYPDDYWSANNAWITCMDRGHEREAGTMARRVADLRPNDPLSLYEAWKSNDAEPDISNRYLDRLVAMLQEGVELPRYVAASTIWARDVLTPANKGELATAMNAAAKLATELQDQPQPAGFALSLGKTHQADDLASPQFWSMHLIIAEQRGDREALRKLVHDSGKRELHNSLVPGLLARAGYVDDARRLAQRYAAFLAEYTIGQAFTQGEIALAEGKTHAAILLLREAYEHFSAARQPPVFLAAEDLARALDRIHQTHEAIRVLEPLEKDHRFNFESSFAPGTDQLLLAQLYRKVGRINEAKRIEGELLALWKNADPDFQPLIQLKRQTGIQKIQ